MWFVVGERAMADQVKVFEQRTFSEDLQHVTRRDRILGVCAKLEGAKVLEQTSGPGHRRREAKFAK